MVQCRALQRSISLWMRSPELRKKLSMTTFFRHLRCHHRQYIKFKKAVDICPVCHKYDRLVLPKVRKALDEAQNGICCESPSYFAELDKFWEAKKQAGKTDPVS